MSFNIPNVFIAGKKAIANEVNENFETIKDEINSHKNRITTLTNSVNSFDEALNGGLKDELITLIKNSKALFCVNIGNLNSEGNGELLAIDSLVANTISFKVSEEGGDFSPITYTNAFGVTTTSTFLKSITLDVSTDGVYKFYARPTGEVYALNNSLIINKIMPEMSAGDVWLNISRVPFEAKTYNGISYDNFEDVPIGEATVSNGAITEVKTYAYNQNGFDVNIDTTAKPSTFVDSIYKYCIPNYDNLITKSGNTKHIADTDGYILFQTNLVANAETRIWVNGFNLYYKVAAYNSIPNLIPVAKGDEYRSDGSANLYFLPKRV